MTYDDLIDLCTDPAVIAYIQQLNDRIDELNELINYIAGAENDTE